MMASLESMTIVNMFYDEFRFIISMTTLVLENNSAYILSIRYIKYFVSHNPYE